MPKECKYVIKVTFCIDTDTYSKLEQYKEQYEYDDISSTMRAILKQKFRDMNDKS